MRRLLIGCAAAFALTACGSSASDDDGATAELPAVTSEDYPKCEDVWVVGESLPDDYEGCYDGTRDTIELASYIGCGDGSRLTSYLDEWWVVTGGTIAQASGGTASDDGYGAAYDACVS